jgi:hypothetical protein
MEINLDNATFIGEGEWVTGSAYQVYELDGKYYALIVSGYSNKEIDESSIIEIKKEDINYYI